MAARVLVPSKGRLLLSIAGLGIEFESHLPAVIPFELPEAFGAFVHPSRKVCLEVSLNSQRSLDRVPGTVLYDSKLNWLLVNDRGRTVFESYHPPSSRLLTRAEALDDFRRYEILFDEGNWCWLWNSRPGPGNGRALELPSPLSQLLILPALARVDGFLLHACGAIVNGRALVFPGHSGDGKTTLARMLAAEGLEILSDERIAIRKQNGIFMVYGTPWPGEGNVVSSAAYPLAGVFVLRKARQHGIRSGPPSTAVANLLARSIVPYYFPEETAGIVRLAHQVATAVPLADLDFSLKPGLLDFLLDARGSLCASAIA